MLTGTLEEPDVTRPVLSEMKIGPHHHRRHRQPLFEHLGHELPGLQMPDLGQVEHPCQLDPCSFEELESLVDVGYQIGVAARGKNFGRVGVEGQNGRHIARGP